MRHARPILCLVVAGIGVLIASFPAITVWRAGGQALAQLPVLPVPTDDSRQPLALADPSFVLATRTLSETSATEVEAALRRDGYQPTEARGGRWFAKACCGESDAVWVRVEDGPGNTAVATLTMADADARSSWPLFVGVGVLVIAGAIGAGPRRRRAAQRPGSPAAAPSTPGPATIR